MSKIGEIGQTYLCYIWYCSNYILALHGPKLPRCIARGLLRSMLCLEWRKSAWYKWFYAIINKRVPNASLRRAGLKSRQQNHFWVQVDLNSSCWEDFRAELIIFVTLVLPENVPTLYLDPTLHSQLIKMAYWRVVCDWVMFVNILNCEQLCRVMFVNILDCEQRPPIEVAYQNCLDLCWLGWIST